MKACTPMRLAGQSPISETPCTLSQRIKRSVIFYSICRDMLPFKETLGCLSSTTRSRILDTTNVNMHG